MIHHTAFTQFYFAQATHLGTTQDRIWRLGTAHGYHAVSSTIDGYDDLAVWRLWTMVLGDMGNLSEPSGGFISRLALQSGVEPSISSLRHRRYDGANVYILSYIFDHGACYIPSAIHPINIHTYHTLTTQ